jgi:AFG3 family protein
MDKLVKTKSTTTFKDVAGMDEAKKEIVEFVSFLKEPERYKKLGARIPRGAILMGPPGTGKTLLAKAVAGEADVDFYSMAGSDFVEMYVGVGAARVRDLFAQARKSKKAIIYIDEIDAIGKPRGSGASGGNDEREGTLNQLLVELDGFTENENIIVFASTNVGVEDLDAALLRPGRFDRQISIDKPDLSGRVEIYKIHMKPLRLGDDISVERLANLTPGFSGAEIHNVCNEAAIIAARKDAENITMKHFEEAIERVIGGVEKKHKVISPQEKKAIAYHEAGHAIVAWFSNHCDPLLKISVIPRGQTLGYAQYVPIERHIHTQAHLMDILAQAIGGRAAEQVVFGEISTGARDDLQKITRIAYSAVSMYGMSSMGAISFPPPGNDKTSTQKPYGEKVARIIDEEVKVMVSGATDTAIRILKEKRELLETVAEYLIKNEVMSTDQFREVAGPRPFEKIN